MTRTNFKILAVLAIAVISMIPVVALALSVPKPVASIETITGHVETARPVATSEAISVTVGELPTPPAAPKAVPAPKASDGLKKYHDVWACSSEWKKSSAGGEYRHCGYVRLPID